MEQDIDTYVSILNDNSAGVNERIEACHALGRIYGRRSIDALMAVLVDREFSVRWAAAEALREHGYNAIKPLLMELETHPADQRLYECAHHVLVSIMEPSTRSLVQPVIDALEEGAGKEAAVPLAAFEALGELRQY